MIHALYVAYCDTCGKHLHIEPQESVDSLRSQMKRLGHIEVKDRYIRGWLRSKTYCNNCKPQQKENQ